MKILLTLFYEFFKIGIFTFGGGYAMIPLIRETVLKYNWVSESQFYDFIGVCESTPGPIAINMATFMGSSQFGFLGALVATLAVVLPSFIIILLIASLLKNLMKNKYVQRILEGIKPVIIALITAAGITMFLSIIGYQNKKIDINYISIIIFSIITLGYYFIKIKFNKKINAILLIVIGAALGIAFGYIC